MQRIGETVLMVKGRLVNSLDKRCANKKQFAHPTLAMIPIRVFSLFLIALATSSCSDYDPNYDYELYCQSDNSPYGVWEAKKVGSRSEMLTNGTADALYRMAINRDNTYDFCDDKNCMHNEIMPRLNGTGVYLKGFSDATTTKQIVKLSDSFIELTGSDLIFYDQSCHQNPHNQYCENKQCMFFGNPESTDWFVFVKIKDL